MPFTWGWETQGTKPSVLPCWESQEQFSWQPSQGYGVALPREHGLLLTLVKPSTPKPLTRDWLWGRDLRFRVISASPLIWSCGLSFFVPILNVSHSSLIHSCISLQSGEHSCLILLRENGSYWARSQYKFIRSHIHFLPPFPKFQRMRCHSCSDLDFLPALDPQHSSHLCSRKHLCSLVSATFPRLLLSLETNRLEALPAQIKLYHTKLKWALLLGHAWWDFSSSWSQISFCTNQTK